VLVFLESVGVEGRQDAARPKTEFVSNWRRRLQQIKQLKARLTPASEGPPGTGAKRKDLESIINTLDFSTWT
jgi:hypothetical protein